MAENGKGTPSVALSGYLNLLRSAATNPSEDNLRHSDENLVKITVGTAPNIEGHVVHDHCDCHCSRVLTSVFQEAFPKAHSRVTDLAITIQTNPQAFFFFIQWAYEHHFDAASSSLADLISVWILANKLSIPELQNFAITTIVNSSPGDSLVELDFTSIWKNTPRRCVLRSLLIDAIVIRDPRFMTTQNLSKVMLLEVIDVLRKSSVYPGPGVEKYFVNAD